MPRQPQVENTSPVPLERIAAFMRQFAHDLNNDLNALDLAATYIAEITEDESVREELARQRSTIHKISKALESASLHLQRPSPVLLQIETGDLLEGLRDRLIQSLPVEMESCTWSLDPGVAEIEVDFEMCCHALVEVFRGVCRRCDEAAGLVFRANCIDGKLRIALESACAIPPPALEQLGVTPFVSINRRYYGIGLFYAGRAVAAHGGNLSVHHDAGRGLLTVEIFLPLKTS